MATEVIIPTLGEVVQEVIISQWLKAEGDRVKQGDPLLEVESEKVTVEVESPTAGTLGKILFPRGAKVPVTHVVAIVLAPGESLPEGYGHAAPDVSEERAAPSQSDASSGKTTQVRAAPLARRLARQHNIDLALVAPSGPHNTIMKMDVEAYLAAAKEEAKEAKVEERVKASPLARSMAAIRENLRRTVFTSGARSKPIIRPNSRGQCSFNSSGRLIRNKAQRNNVTTVVRRP